ncbi:hypothetical protein OH492_13650 [Vibrio chagasii]|nr:hypothetical protein [Vibrio chagasii]
MVFGLIEITPEDIPNLDSVLPPLLRQYGIQRRTKQLILAP